MNGDTIRQQVLDRINGAADKADVEISEGERLAIASGFEVYEALRTIADPEARFTAWGRVVVTVFGALMLDVPGMPVADRLALWLYVTHRMSERVLSSIEEVHKEAQRQAEEEAPLV